jgi:hypothetical protein
MKTRVPLPRWSSIPSHYSFLSIRRQQKYKKLKRSVKSAEQDYRNRLAAIEAQLKIAESYKRKLSTYSSSSCCCVD